MAAMNRKAGNHTSAGKGDAAKDGSLFVFTSFRRIRRQALHVADDSARTILRQRPESDQTKERGRGPAKRNVKCGDASGCQQHHQRSDDLVSGLVRDVLEDEQRADEVKWAGTGKRFDPDERHVVQSGLFRIRPRVLENRPRNIAGDDVSRAPRQWQRQSPGAASEVEDAIERYVAAEERHDRWKKRRDITFAGFKERGVCIRAPRHVGRAVIVEKREIRLASGEIFPILHDGSVRVKPYAIARARDPCGRSFHATYGLASCRSARFLNA